MKICARVLSVKAFTHKKMVSITYNTTALTHRHKLSAGENYQGRRPLTGKLFMYFFSSMDKNAKPMLVNAVHVISGRNLTVRNENVRL